MARRGSEDAKILGAAGEQMAAEYLIAHGYTIRERNWRLNHLEVDIIAQSGTMIVFVEVKTRSDSSVDPIAAVNDSKRRNLFKAADTYLRNQPFNFSYRFDIACVTGATPDTLKLEYVEDAFIPTLRGWR